MTRSHLHSLLIFVWLVLGYCSIHMLLCFWSAIALQSFQREAGNSESLQVTEDGEPLIGSWKLNVGMKYRRLNGELVAEQPSKFASGHWIAKLRHGSKKTIDEPYSWGQRLYGFCDYQPAAANWYFVIPPNREGKSYLMGYDQRSRKFVGYLGTKGFSDHIPDAAESFSIPSGFQGTIASAQDTQIRNYSTVGEPPVIESDSSLNIQVMSNASSDMVWILSEGTLYEIRLRTRAVRTLLENHPEYHFLAAVTPRVDKRLVLKLILRSETEFLVIDPESEKSEAFVVGELPDNSYETFYQLDDGRRFLIRSERSTEQVVQHDTILWLAANGQVERGAEVDLKFQWAKPPIEMNTGLAIMFPVPIVSIGSWVISPFTRFFEEKDLTWSGRFWKFFGLFYGWIAITLLAGLFTGWACRQRERNVFGRTGWFWPILVGVFGFFGWMGYICVHPLPARLPGGKWLPKTPEPIRPLGTEIFA